MKKQPEVTEQTRKNLLTAFCRLYEQRPIEQIHVKDVAAAAGYHRSTFYEYFQDIYALLAYLEDDVIDYIKAESSKGPRTPADLLCFLSAKEDSLKVLLGPFGCVHFQDRLKEKLMPAEDAAQGDARQRAYLSEFHFAVSMSMYRLWLKRGKDISLDELTRLIHTLYTAGAGGVSPSSCG